MDKARILLEIQRTADANDGKPIGRQRFTTETGIKDSDWRGIHWARWSDALKEAGFTPNQASKAYSSSTLLEAYANLTLELGRFPTDAELTLKYHTDPKFPSCSTFIRLGRKPEIIDRLLQYCEMNNKYGAVIEMCKKFVPRRRPPESGEAEDSNVCFVHLVKAGQFYKIFHTNALGPLEHELAIQIPDGASTVHIIRTDDPCGITAYWHKRFKEKCKYGDWFELETMDVAAFQRRSFM